MDISLLVTGIYHAVNGLRAIIFDFGLSAKAQRTVTLALTAFGVVVLLFGINTLLVFLRGRPFLW
jgi:succinate dehydrogenase hydrophobic anchor subunit